MDWFTPLVGAIGLLIGLGYHEYRIRRERKDKPADMVFERRLDAHQEVYCRLKGLLGFMSPDQLMKEGGTKTLRKELLECCKCVDRNALYLARDCRREIVKFFDYVRKRGNRYEDEEWVKSVDVKKEMDELLHNMTVVLDSVEKGVGVKYLPEEKMRLEESFRQELHDEALDKAERLASKRKE